MFKRLILIGKVTIYLILAIYFFLELVNFMQFPTSSQSIKNQDINQTLSNLHQQEEKEIEQILQEHFKLGKNEYNASSEIDTSLTFLDKIEKKYVFFNYILNNNNQVIPLIYIITMITFLLQSILLALSSYYRELLTFFTEKKLDSLFLYISEWTINSPPVLGVIGTIFSFGMVVGNLQDMSSLSTVFKENFPNAALTTILGGVVYVLNLWMNIFIAKNLTKK